MLRPELLQEEPRLFSNRFGLGKSILKAVGTQLLFAPPQINKVILSLNGFDGTVPEEEMLFLLDVRGYGECAETIHGVNTEDFYSRYANMFGESYLAGKVNDVVAALQLLRQWGAKHILLKAQGEMTVVARYAAASADAVELSDTLPTFEQLAQEIESPYPEWLFPFTAHFPKA